MSDNEMYQMVNGEPMLTTRGMSLLLGVPTEEILAESKRHNGQPWNLPNSWIKSGRRRTKEFQAATGRTDIDSALEYWAAKEER